MKIGDWVYGGSDDWFRSCSFSTKEECIEEAGEIGETVIYVGEVCEKYKIGSHIVDYLIETIEEDIFEFNGNDELSEGTKEDRDTLLEDITKALTRFYGGELDNYAIRNIEKVESQDELYHSQQ